MEKQRVRSSFARVIVWCLVAGGLLAGYMVYGSSAGQWVRPLNGHDLFYPNMPSCVRTMGSPKEPLLRRSATVEGIVAWAEKVCGPLVEYHSAVGRYPFFVVMHDVGSGISVWRYVLYSQWAPVKGRYTCEWEAVATGCVCNGVKYPMIRSAYIDEAKRDLVFVGVDGKDIRRVRLPGSLWKDRVAASKRR